MITKLINLLNIMCDLGLVEKSIGKDYIDYYSLVTGEVFLSMHGMAITWMDADVVKLLDKLA